MSKEGLTSISLQTAYRVRSNSHALRIRTYFGAGAPAPSPSRPKGLGIVAPLNKFKFELRGLQYISVSTRERSGTYQYPRTSSGGGNVPVL